MKKRIYLLGAFFLLVPGWLAGCQTRPFADEAPAATTTPPTVTTSQPTATPAYTPAFAQADCQFPYPAEADIQCGYLIVPEDRANPQRTIRLHVAVVSSHTATPAPDPVIFLDGGPGGFTLAGAERLIALHDVVLRERDLILFDQRGVGYSEPSLDCPELEEARLTNIEKSLDDAAWHTINLAATAACRQRLTAQGINLSAYNSAASAADLHDLRQALGYDAWNLLGVSYGTRLALTAMRDFGLTGTIRSVILDSVYPPQVNGFTDLGVNADRAFDLLFDRCAGNEPCNRAYPNLRPRFYQLVDSLNAEPLTVAVFDRAARTTYRLPFDGDDLIATLFDMLYDRRQISALPKMLSQLERGYSSILTDHLGESWDRTTYISEGMGLSVQCAEEAPFTTEAEIKAAAQTLPPQLAHKFETNATNVLQSCALWQIEASAPLENEAVRSDIPTLILAGDYDPITPPSFAQELAAYLPNAFLFEFIGVSHGVMGAHACGAELAAAFLTDPTTLPDASCLPATYLGFLTQ